MNFTFGCWTTDRSNAKVNVIVMRDGSGDFSEISRKRHSPIRDSTALPRGGDPARSFALETDPSDAIKHSTVNEPSVRDWRASSGYSIFTTLAGTHVGAS
jgi:hypothetical protein